MLATQAIAVYVEPEKSRAAYGPPTDFDALPVRLRIRVLEACEEEFRRHRRQLIKDGLATGDDTLVGIDEI